MGLMSTYLTSTKKLEDFLNTIITAQAPEKFTIRFLQQLDFNSASDRLYVGLLKGLGFLNEDGAPTERYYKYLDQGQSRLVMADAIREAYSDLFAINKRANELSEDDVRNKLRTLTQGKKSEDVIGKMASTFSALAALADWSKDGEVISGTNPKLNAEEPSPPVDKVDKEPHHQGVLKTQLHYNVQIHLPESRDPLVYDAIFRALREHLA
jgi:hypothetical protein